MEKLSYVEKVELSYFGLKCFRYITRSELGNVLLFKNKPERAKEVHANKAFGYWSDMTEQPISPMNLDSTRYNFITWNDEPMLILSLLHSKKEMF